MPTLREFVEQTLAENHLDSNVDQIIKQITDIARQRAEHNVAAICDEEVREMVINNADLANKLAQEKEAKAKEEAEKKAQEERLKEEQRAEQKKQKALEKERKVADGEQLSLGLFGE